MLGNAEERLTLREKQVLRLISVGLTYQQVAEALGISAHTVGSHIKNLYRKLDVHKASAAVLRGLATAEAVEGERP